MMLKIKHAFVQTAISACLVTQAFAAINLSGGYKDLNGYTEGLSGNITVTGVNYIANGTLLLQPGTTLNFTANAGLVILSYGNDGRKAGQLLALGTPTNRVIFNAQNNTAKGIMMLGRDAIQSSDTNLCTEGFGSECESAGSLYNYGSLNPTNFRNDSCGILNHVTINSLGQGNAVTGADTNALTLGGCGRGTLLNDIIVNDSGDDGIELFGGDATVQNAQINRAQDDGIDWDSDYQGWLLNPIVDSATASSFEGSNTYAPLGPVLCSNSTVSINPGDGDLNLRSGNLFTNNPALFNMIMGSGSLQNTAALPFGTNCPSFAPFLSNSSRF
ncbi:MAG: hypothetical protein CMF38_07400 [Legionellaceae bacterium]|nr:hypothetical protein [Legionellaceae bacterium]